MSEESRKDIEIFVELFRKAIKDLSAELPEENNEKNISTLAYENIFSKRSLIKEILLRPNKNHYSDK